MGVGLREVATAVAATAEERVMAVATMVAGASAEAVAVMAEEAKVVALRVADRVEEPAGAKGVVAAREARGGHRLVIWVAAARVVAEAEGRVAKAVAAEATLVACWEVTGAVATVVAAAAAVTAAAAAADSVVGAAEVAVAVGAQKGRREEGMAAVTAVAAAVTALAVMAPGAAVARAPALGMARRNDGHRRAVCAAARLQMPAAAHRGWQTGRRCYVAATRRPACDQWPRCPMGGCALGSVRGAPRQFRRRWPGWRCWRW